MGRLVEMVWDCKYCGSKGIGGSKRECPHCGKPRDDGTKFEMPTGKINYVPEEEASKINRNPDWICEFCNNLNSDSYYVCQSCGAERTSNNLNYFENQKLREPKEANESSAESSNFSISNSSNEFHPSENLEGSEAVKNFDEIDEPVGKWTDKVYNGLDVVTNFLSEYWKNLLILISLIVVVAGLIYIFIPKTETIKVETLHWERTIAIERFQTVNESSWNLPSDARLQYTRQEIYTYEQVLDHYEDKTRQVKKERIVRYEEKVVGYRDLGNGYAEEITERVPVYETYYETEHYQDPVYRNEPVYKKKYYYEIDRWIHNRDLNTAGYDKSPYWPDLSTLTEKEREESRKETYYVYGNNSKGKSKEIILPYNEWNDVMEGDTIKVKVNMLGIGKLA